MGLWKSGIGKHHTMSKYDITLPETINIKFDQFKPNVACLLEDTWTIINGELFEAKRGFWFDGMSGGKLAWVLIDHPFAPRIIIQVLWHDLFYGTQYFERWKADEILNAMNLQRNKDWEDASVKCKISWSERRIMNTGLYLGGGFAYNSKTDEQIKGCSKHLYVSGKQFIP